MVMHLSELLIDLAYANYSIWEWGLLLMDVIYDSACILEFKGVNISVTLPFIRPVATVWPCI